MPEELTVDGLLKSAMRAGMSNNAMYYVAHLLRMAQETERKIANLEERVSATERITQDDGK